MVDSFSLVNEHNSSVIFPFSLFNNCKTSPLTNFANNTLFFIFILSMIYKDVRTFKYYDTITYVNHGTSLTSVHLHKL